MPTVEKLIDELHGACIFSKLDPMSGYYEIKMAKEDIYKITFIIHEEHYEFLAMLFGLTYALATF